MTARALTLSSLVRGLVLFGMMLPIADRIETQARVRFGRGSASISMPVQLEVPISLKVSAVGNERVVERAETYTEIEVPVRVSANVGWSLTVALGATSGLGPVLLRSMDGEWHELVSAVPRAAISSPEPANAFEVKLRLRLPAAAASTAAFPLRLSLVPGSIPGL